MTEIQIVCDSGIVIISRSRLSKHRLNIRVNGAFLSVSDEEAKVIVNELTRLIEVVENDNNRDQTINPS